MTATPSDARVFRQTANDYYMSRTATGHRSLANPTYEYSHYRAVPMRRLELQSFAAGDQYDSNGSSFFGKRYRHGESSNANNNKASGNGSPLAKIDELGIVVYDPKQHDDVETDLTSPLRSHDRNILELDHSHGQGHHRHGRGERGRGRHHHEARRNTDTDDNESINDLYSRYYDLSRGMHHHGHHRGEHGHRDQRSKEGYFDNDEYYSHERHGHEIITQIPEQHGEHDEDEDDDDDVEENVKPAGLLSLFKYSTKWDMVLVILGCIGALINGGSLPWYSYLFGNFVNKISQESDLNKMMKDVQKVSPSLSFKLTAI